MLKYDLIKPHDVPKNNEFRIICPECGNPKGKCYVNALGKGSNCFHCTKTHSWYGFQRLFEPPTAKEAALENFTTLCQEYLKQSPEVLQYLQQRGLTEQSLIDSKLGYLPKGYDAAASQGDKEAGLFTDKWALEGRLIIPYLKDGYVQTVRGRVLDDSEPKYKSLPGSTSGPYHLNLDLSKPIYICEGEIDAILMNQLGYQSIGFPGVTTVQSHLETILKFPKIYLALDGDQAGRAAAKKLLAKLPEAFLVDLPEEPKDICDYLNAFGPESLKALIDNSQFYVEGRIQEDDSLSTTITEWINWSWSNSTLLGPQISWAPRLENALSGWSRGLFLIGASANSGKSCFLVKSAYEAAKDNPSALVIYLSLDDDREDAVCRLASLHTGISFEELRTPRISFDHPTDLSKRQPNRLKYIQEKMDELKSWDNLVIRDARFGRSLQYIRSYCATLRKKHPDRQIILLIDSLAKLTAENEPQSISVANWKSHLANELKFLSTLHNLCIVCPTDLRKLNDARRPSNDDLKDAAELAYEASAVLLGFNEVSLKGAEDATLTWTDPNGKVWPILELNLSKNKKSMYRGAIRFKFHPATSNYMELTEAEDQEFTRKIKENEQRKREAKYGGGAKPFPTYNAFSVDIGRFQ